MASAVEHRKAEVDGPNETLEHRVEERTEELVLANRELESFSYSVSHDLRAPLRAIDGFSEMLQSQCHAVLPDEAQRFIQRVRSGAVRMGALIDDLLSFSRVTRTELVRQTVSLDAIVQETIETAERLGRSERSSGVSRIWAQPSQTPACCGASLRTSSKMR